MTMKKLLRILLLTSILLLTNSQVRAESPYNTWALGPGGEPVMTQDAYTPIDAVELDVSGPEDMFITPDGSIYIADTGNGRILKLQDFKEVASYGEDILQGPTGLFIDEEGIMYIADAKQNSIVILDSDGNLINQFGRPTAFVWKKGNFYPTVASMFARIYISSAKAPSMVSCRSTPTAISLATLEPIRQRCL
jgi:hypothetical protein